MTELNKYELETAIANGIARGLKEEANRKSNERFEMVGTVLITATFALAGAMLFAIVKVALNG